MDRKKLQVLLVKANDDARSKREEGISKIKQIQY